MKILHIYKTYYPDSYGGVEQVIYHLANKATQNGICADVFTMSHTQKSLRYGNIHYENHNVYQMGTDFTLAATPFSFAAIKHFRKIAKNYDILHYHYPYPFADLFHLIAHLRKPSLVTYHSDIINQKYLKYVYKPVQTLFLDRVDHIVATSQNYIDSSPVLQKYRSKTSAILLGLEDKYTQDFDRDVYTYWQKRFEKPFFLFLGALRNYKGVHILLEAAKGLDFDIVIAGGGEALDAVKRNSQTIPNVHFTGKISEADKYALLDLCYGVVLPSHLRSEAFGLVLVEGAMWGKPLISTELGTGTSFINLDGQTGIVIEPRNISALRQALQFLIADREQAKQMGMAARQRFEDLFQAEKMYDSYIHLYKDLVKDNI